jgi:hypothetical protein
MGWCNQPEPRGRCRRISGDWRDADEQSACNLWGMCQNWLFLARLDQKGAAPGWLARRTGTGSGAAVARGSWKARHSTLRERSGAILSSPSSTLSHR